MEVSQLDYIWRASGRSQAGVGFSSNTLSMQAVQRDTAGAETDAGHSLSCRHLQVLLNKLHSQGQAEMSYGLGGVLSENM